MDNKLLIISLILAVSLTSCGSHKKTVSYKDYNYKKNNNATVLVPKKDIVLAKEVFDQIKGKAINPKPETLSYIENFAPLAMIEMTTYKIPASITLAQAILESNSGKSELAIKSNNHFGVKCHKDWHGKRVYHNDDKKHECFRKYRQPLGSFKDHSLFLKKGKRYNFLFQLKRGDYRAWADGLKYAGYATDPNYPKKLVKIIENYHLYSYDTEVLRQEKLKNRFDNERAIAIAKSNEEVKTLSVADRFRLKQANNQDPKKLGKKVNVFNNVYDYYDEAAKKANAAKRNRNVNKPVGKKINKKPVVQQPVKKVNLNQPKKKPVVVVVNKQPKEKVKVANSKPVKQTKKDLAKQANKKQVNKPIDKSILNKLKKPTKPVVSNDVVKSTKVPNKVTVSNLSDKKNNHPNKKPITNKKTINYIVKKGETLYAISRKFNVTVEELKTWNNLNSNNIAVGQELIINGQTKNVVVAKKEVLPTHSVKTETYIVKKGETLYAISKKYNVTVEELKAWNNLDSNNIAVGQEIIIKK